ncbi:MAG: POT family MFS transporter [Candidatus Didemnitutus sp.]|nr:POT family MFS transporter [Candidatus Didemnitutus sp.]MDP2137196.1 POT family MFS transporter [Candidatus Didemnitutus sp.]
MADTPLLTAPLKTDKMPPGIPYIIGNEAAERFSFYGMRAILVVFMTQYLRDKSGMLSPMNEAEASTWYHLFLASNYFFPIFGAILADAFFGKYRTIFWLSLVYCVGHLALAVDDTRLGLGIGLSLIALGAGGIKPCVSANVGDQFGATNQHLLSRAFGWFYFSINFGSFFSILLIPWVLENHSPNLAFGIPGILMLVATIVFRAGRKKFVHVPPAGKAFIRENFNRAGWAAIGRIGIIFVFVAVFWSLWDQSGGRWVLQASKMDLHFAGITWLPSQIQAVNAIMILIFIPLFQYLIYPAINVVFPLNPLRKIGLGIFVSGVAFLVSAWIESQIVAGLIPNIGWQLPAYALLTASEVMVSITALEFAYTQAPKHMKSVIMSLYLLSISAGNLITALVNYFIQNPDGTVKLTGADYYLFFTALAILASVAFAFVARKYKEQTHLQDEASEPASA